MVSFLTCLYENTTPQVHSCASHISYNHPSLIQSNVEPERLQNHTREGFVSSGLTLKPNVLLGAYRHSKEYGSMYVCLL